MTTEPDPLIDEILNPQDDPAAYTLPVGVNWIPMCANAAVGAPPNLDDVQAQLLENQSAQAEGRSARTLALRCSFCQGYHIEMQPPVDTLTGGEVPGDPSNIGDSIPPVSPPPVDESLVAEAVDALDPSAIVSEYEPGAEVANDGSSSTNPDSGSSPTEP